MKKYILITVFVCAALSSVFAQNYRKPKKGEVVLVFSAEVIPAVNREFFKNYLETPHASWLSFAVSESRGAFTKGEPGDTVSVFFEENKGRVYITNASQITLSEVQSEMRGESEKAGFQTEDDVVSYIKELRLQR